MTVQLPQDSEGGTTKGSGSASLSGYLYQVRVSVYLALVLLLERRDARQITLEPSSEEDIEAEVETNAAELSVSASLPRYTLVVQVKHKSTGPWGIKAIERLMTEERAHRVTPNQRLADKDVRYLLVTDAAVTGQAGALRITQIGQWPRAPSLRGGLLAELGAEAEGRVAILSQFDERLLDALVKELLFDSFHVPRSRCEPCYGELCKVATDRMVGRASNVWSREALEAVVRRFDGFLASSPDLAFYVRPKNWDMLCRNLNEHHALVLTGKSGTGKTMTAEALWEHLRSTERGFVKVKVDPARLGHDVVEYQGKDPVLFDIEDPWGRFKFEEQHRVWNAALPKMLHTASGTRKFVVTSRSDVLGEADAPPSLKRWMVRLEPDSYTVDDRQSFYDKKARTLPRALESLASAHRENVLEQLETLFELQKFFDFLITDDPEGDRSGRVRRATEHASVEAIERTIQDQIRARNALHWSYIVWGVFQASRSIEQETIDELHGELADRADIYERGMQSLLSFMVAGRNLRQKDSLYAYAHPRVEAALKHLVVSEPVAAAKRLVHLIEAYVALGNDGVAGRGLRSAARVLKASRSVPNLKLKVPVTTEDALDAWLTEQLATAQADYDTALELAAAAGSNRCVPAEFARYLTRHATISLFHAYPPPKHEPKKFVASEDWLKQVAAHPLTRTIAERFVRDILPGSSSMYEDSLIQTLERVAGDLTSEYVSGVQTILATGGMRADDTVVLGALKDLDALAPVALKAMKDSLSIGERSPKELLAITNGEYSEGELQRMGEDAGEADHTPDLIATAYVRERRLRDGWQALTRDPATASLHRWWLSVIRKAEPPHAPVDEEWLFIANLAIGSPHEDQFWRVAEEIWSTCLEPHLASRLVARLDARQTRLLVLNCALHRAPGVLDTAVSELVERADFTRLVELHSDVGYLRTDGSDRNRKAWLDLGHTSLPAPLQNHLRILFEVPIEAWLPTDDLVIALANKIERWSEDATLWRLRVHSSAKTVSIEEVKTFLDSARDSGNAELAMSIAVQHRMGELVNEGLAHRFAAVVAKALAGASNEETVVPDRVLALATHPSHFVKEALLAVLAQCAAGDYLATLVQLCLDTWSDSSMHYQDDVSLPVAREAATLIAQVSRLSDAHEATLFERALDTYDDKLRTTLFNLIARIGTSASQARLLKTALASRRSIGKRMSAALALHGARSSLAQDVVDRICMQRPAELPPLVAACLLAIIGERGTLSEVRRHALELREVHHRQVLILLLADGLRERDEAEFAAVTKLLPPGHAAMGLFRGQEQGRTLLPRCALDDLGDVASVAVALSYFHARVEPKKK